MNFSEGRAIFFLLVAREESVRHIYEGQSLRQLKRELL
jgi:hypothetical protein